MWGVFLSTAKIKKDKLLKSCSALLASEGTKTWIMMEKPSVGEICTMMDLAGNLAKAETRTSDTVNMSTVAASDRLLQKERTGGSPEPGTS